MAHASTIRGGDGAVSFARRIPWLFFVVLVYLALGTAYAARTPRWQVPDEPAHYNYVAELAATGRLPVLDPGEYPNDYLEKIKAARFPPNMPVDSIRYESWQPPLYYALAAVVFKLTAALPGGWQFLALRLLSVLFGTLLLLVAYRIVRSVFPGDDLLAISTAAFVAFLPMHLTMTAAVDNDTLAELVLALLIWLALERLMGHVEQRRYMLLGGVLLGLALLAKSTIYPPAAAMLAGGAAGYWWRCGHDPRDLPVRPLAGAALIALAISGWWFVRNALTYGGLDILAWNRHAQVVTGQPRTVEWIAQYGAPYVAREFVVTTFKSFWGVFGWMGVPMPERFYGLLALVTAAGGLGLVVWLARLARGKIILPPERRLALLLLALTVVLAAAMHVGYNLSFVQHQGRYLFPGLVGTALFFNLGLREWNRRLAPVLFVPGYLALAGLAAYSLVRFIIPYLSP